ncbi:MAG: hypothetical protein G01um101413_49 [Parcubacteria group bacterium Gr01-1014_13]|nr:MAG: hypothetical protein G01um101413_49 [Parcubacteria group bacterium Gr01-1014_13]
MVINLHELLHLPVYTESEVKLGRIFDLELDVNTQTVMRYLVRQNFLSASYLLVASAQVKEIKHDRVVVYDSVLKAEAGGELALEE